VKRGTRSSGARRRSGTGRSRGGRRSRSRSPEARDPRRELETALDAVRDGTLRRGFAGSRDAMAAMAVVRAIERARGLVSEVGGSPALRKALREAEAPLASYLEAKLRPTKPARRKKA